MRRIVLALAVLAVALTACDLRAEISVNDDGSGTVGMVFLVEPDMLELMKQPGGSDPFADLRADLADDPVAWDVEEFTEGRLRGIRAVFGFASIDDLLDKMDALSGDQERDAGLEDFSIRRQDGGWAFEGRSTDPQSQLAGGPIPIPVEQLASMLKIQFRVTLPGKAASHNADEVSAGGGVTTFVWKPELTSRSVELRAATRPAGTPIPLLPIGLGVGALALASIIGGVRRRGSASTEAGVSVPADEVADAVGAHAGVDTDPTS